MSIPNPPIDKTTAKPNEPDRAAVRAAAHLRRMWLIPFLAVAWLIAEFAALPFAFFKFLGIIAVFAALYFVFSWRLRVLTLIFDQRLRSLVKEQDRVIQAAVREKNGILARLGTLEEQLQAAGLREQSLAAHHEGRRQEMQAQEQAVQEAGALWPSLLSVLTRIEQQLSATTDLDDLREIGARGAYEIASAAGLESRAAIYRFDPQAQQLLRMAQWPEPVRRRLPGGQRSGPRRVVGLPLRFEPDSLPILADSAAFWTLYVKRQPFITEDGALFDTLEDEPVARLALRMPLVSGRDPVGHLSLLLTTLPSEPVQDALASVLGSFAGIVALAISNASALDTVQKARAEQAFLSDLSALATAGDPNSLAAFLQERLCPLLFADVCALSPDGKMPDVQSSPALSPERDLIHAAALTSCACDAALQKTAKSGEIVEQTAVRNPKAGACLWKHYGGVSGVHSVAAVPIPTRGKSRAALMVYRPGAEPLTADETAFVTSVAAILSAVENNP